MRIALGKTNRLTVTRRSDFGFYLDGGEAGEVLLPNRYVPSDLKVGQEIDVFVYLDSEERLTATTQMPYAQVGDFAYLRVAWVNQYGAFMDWGLMKDLFVPFAEQKVKMQPDRYYFVHIHVDEETCRIMASAKVERYLSTEMPPYVPGQEVEAFAWQHTDLGYRFIIDSRYAALAYEDEVFRPIGPGDRLKAYIRQVRPDGKIDLMLQRPGQGAVTDFSAQLLQYIKEHGGAIPQGDKTPAEDIYDTFGVSKKVFKKAVGDLYKQHLITISPQGLQLV